MHFLNESETDLTHLGFQYRPQESLANHVMLWTAASSVWASFAFAKLLTHSELEQDVRRVAKEAGIPPLGDFGDGSSFGVFDLTQERMNDLLGLNESDPWPPQASR